MSLDEGEDLEEWSPEKEREEDPVRFAKKYMKWAKRMMGGLTGQASLMTAQAYVPPSISVVLIDNGAIIRYPALTDDGKRVREAQVHFHYAEMQLEGPPGSKEFQHALRSIVRVQAFYLEQEAASRALFEGGGDIVGGEPA